MSKKIYTSPIERLAASLFDAVKHSARSNSEKRRANSTMESNNIRKEIDIDYEWILNRLKEINCKCEVTGIPFSMFTERVLSRDMNELGCNALNSASVDRIDNSKGYVKGNVRIVNQFINNGRNTKSVEDVIEMIEWIKNPPKENKIYSYKQNGVKANSKWF